MKSNKFAKMFHDEDNGLRSLRSAMQSKDARLAANILRDNAELLSYKNQLGENLLHLAVKCDFVDLVDCLIDLGLKVDSADHCNRTPLHFAITRKNSSIARRLLSRNASKSAKNLYGKSPFHLAVNSGDLATIDLLLSSGADVADATLTTRQTSLHIALRNEDSAAFELLLNHCNSGSLDIRDAYGDTLLHGLARQRDASSSAKLLIDRGADVDLANNDNETPLHLAVHRRNSGMCELLLDHGRANVNLRNKYDESPLHLAVRHKDRKLVELLLSFGADAADAMLHVAVNYYNADVVDALLNSGIDVDARNVHGLTAFHVAVKIKRRDAAAQLLRRGADANKDTPLHTAIAQRDLPSVRFLLEHGASLGDDEIFLAVEFGCASVVELLLCHGANANARDSASGRSLLYAAMRSRDSDKVETLLRSGADRANVDEIDGDTRESALHLAVRARDERFARYLLEDVGVDVNLCDRDDMTALALADGTVARFIVARLALLKFNGLFVCERNESLIDTVGEFASYFAECMKELERIGSTRYAEFLRNDARFWGKCVRRRGDATTIDENFYPIYWEKLLANVDRGVARWNFVRRVRDYLSGMRCFQRLYDVLDDVVDHFSDDELRDFVRAISTCDE